MTKALLIGPAPTLKNDLLKIKEKYDIVCGINSVFIKEMQDILSDCNIELTNYYFSDYLYARQSDKIKSFRCKRKIIIAPLQKMIPKVTTEFEICDQNIVDTINHIGGYSVGTWATTGMLSLGHLLYSEKVDFVKICGFTFGEGKLHLYDDVKLDTTRHSINKEKNIYNFFHKKNKCST